MIHITHNTAPITIINYLDKTSSDIRKNVSLQWKNLADKGETGHRAVIPSIHDRIVTTKFGNETLHQEMVMKTAHPLNNLWEVTVHVEWHNNKPKRYTILSVQEDLGAID